MNTNTVENPAGAYAYDLSRPAPSNIKQRSTPISVELAKRQAKRKRSARKTWLVFGASFAGLALTALVLWFFVIRPMGVGTSLVALTAALVPFSMVLTAVWWLDRYTPQPRMTLLYAFTWGAIGSVAMTYIFGTAVLLLISLKNHDATVQEFLAVAFQAPVVEESMKASGLVLLLLFGRRYISGPIDGVIYAMLIASGFAFTENITYFARSFAEAQVAGNSTAFWQMFFMRGIMSPFAHASFTSLVGLGLGIAAERRSIPLYFLLGFGGLGTGMCLHALWNGGSMWLGLNGSVQKFSSLFLWYLIVEVPIFLTLVLVLLWLRLRERRIVRARLTEYGRAGWFTPDEVRMLERLGTRREAVRWAASAGAVAAWAMRDFQKAALMLAAHRQAALAGSTSTRIRASEAELLNELTHTRRVVAMLTRPLRPLRTMDGR